MTDETSDKGPGRHSRKAHANIDLDAAAITDVTPKPEPETPASAAEPLPGQPAPVAPPANPPARSSAAGPVVGGAVAGAIFGVLSTLVYHNFNAPPVTVADPRLARVEAEMTALPGRTLGATGEAIKPLATRLEGLEQKLAASETKTSAATELAKTAGQRAAALETLTAGMIAPVDERLKTTEAAAGAAQLAAAALTRRLDDIARAAPQTGNVSGLAARLDTLEKAISAANAATGAAATRGTETAGALESRIAQVEAALAGQKPAASPRPALLLAISGLIRQNIDAARPLGLDGAALSGLGIDASVAKPLAVFAAKPMPTPAALGAQLTALAATFPKPQAAPAPEAGLLDKMKANALAFVEVRPAGPAASASPAPLEVLKARIAAGDLKTALEAITALPAAEQTILAPLGVAISEREAALAAYRALERDALAAASRKD